MAHIYTSSNCQHKALAQAQSRLRNTQLQKGSYHTVLVNALH